MSEISTKPYMLRALYEWCTDSGYTPYLAVKVNQFCQVPQAFVKNNEIILNISFGATKGLKLENDSISFSARFGGIAREIYVPVDNVMAIYASENGQGMAFDVQLPSEGATSQAEPASAPAGPSAVSAFLQEAKSALQESDADETPNPEPPKKSGKPTLTRIK